MKFVYTFGYQTLEQMRAQDQFGWDDENSAQIVIRARDESEALSWGNQVAEAFLKWLLSDPNVSWAALEFARRIDPCSENDPQVLEETDVGVMPSFPRLVE